MKKSKDNPAQGGVGRFDQGQDAVRTALGGKRNCCFRQVLDNDPKNVNELKGPALNSMVEKPQAVLLLLLHHIIILIWQKRPAPKEII